MIPRCTCGVILRAPDTAQGWRWAHATDCPSYTEPLPEVETAQDKVLELANGGWIQRDDGWVYPDLDLGDSIPQDEALRIERSWRDYAEELAARPPRRRGTPKPLPYDQIKARDSRDRDELRWIRNVRRVTVTLLLVLAVYAAYLCATDAARAATSHTRSCPSVVACREVAAWNHSIVVDRDQKLNIANGKAGGGRDLRQCHTLAACRTLVAHQKASRIWAEEAWSRLMVDNSAAGAMRIVRYRFQPCGKVAQARAHLIVGWESSWQRFNINGAGDTSWWQIERPAHPDVTLAQAEDAWESTGIAVRWSKCGRDWSPTWSSVRDHGKDWP